MPWTPFGLSMDAGQSSCLGIIRASTLAISRLFDSSSGQAESHQLTKVSFVSWWLSAYRLLDSDPHIVHYKQCSSRKWKGTGTPSAEGARIEALTGWGLGRGYPIPSTGGVWGGGLCPLHRNCFDFLSSNGAFWCILGACFNVSIIIILKQSWKAVLCANCQLVNYFYYYLTWRPYHPWYHTQKHISDTAVSQSDTHAAYTMDIVDIHVHATVYLYILLSCILFQEIELHFTKVTFYWWHVYFMNTLVAYGP